MPANSRWNLIRGLKFEISPLPLNVPLYRIKKKCISKLANSIKYSLTQEAQTYSYVTEILCMLMKQIINYLEKQQRTTGPCLGPINPDHKLSFYLSTIISCHCLRLSKSSVSLRYVSDKNFTHIYFLSYACYMSHSSHPT